MVSDLDAEFSDCDWVEQALIVSGISSKTRSGVIFFIWDIDSFLGLVLSRPNLLVNTSLSNFCNLF